MKKLILIFVILFFIIGCGGDSSENPIPDDSNDGPSIDDGSSNPTNTDNDDISDNSQENAESAQLLSSLARTKQNILFTSFDDEQERIARESSVSGGLISGNHLRAVEDYFQLMLDTYLTDVENDILTIFQGGFLLDSAVSSELDYTKNQFSSFIDNEILPDYSYMPVNALIQFKADLHEILNSSYTLLLLELQSQGIL